MFREEPQIELQQHIWLFPNLAMQTMGTYTSIYKLWTYHSTFQMFPVKNKLCKQSKTNKHCKETLQNRINKS